MRRPGFSDKGRSLQGRGCKANCLCTGRDEEEKDEVYENLQKSRDKEE